MNQVIVRYGPSPTGIPHIGNIRTALFNFLFAKNQGGKFLLRIEDTDQARIVPGAVEKIKESLKVLGISWDEQFIQSQRLEIYQKYLGQLKSKDLAYEDDGAWRFRVKTNKEKIGWEDVVHKKVEFPASVIEDFVIVKSDGFPTYHFASVVDDHEMKITHVLRGDEWISSTPKHILLYEAFGWQHPNFVHLPPILGSDHKKLSKRDGAKSIMEYTDEGYLAEALINFMVLLGWSPKGNQELFSLQELIKEFSLDRINKNSPIFNIEKLNWMNGQWIRRIDEQDLAKRINHSFSKFKVNEIKEILSFTKDRIKTINEFPTMSGFLLEKPNVDSIIPSIPASGTSLASLATSYQNINWDSASIKAGTISVSAAENIEPREMFKSIGMSVSGSTVTPPLFESLEKLGRDETIERLKDVIKKKSE